MTNPLASSPFAQDAGKWDLMAAWSVRGLSGGGIVPIVSKDIQPISVFIPGVPMATEAGSEIQITLQGPNGKVYQARRLTVNAVNAPVGDTDTIVVVSNAGIGDGGQSISLTLPAADSFAEETTGAFAIAAGAKLYFWVAQAGAHADLNITLAISE